METKQIKLEYLAPYLPYGLKGVLVHDLTDDFLGEDWWGEDISIFEMGKIWQYAGFADEDLSVPLGEGEFSGFLIRYKNTYTSVGNSIKPIFRPIEDLYSEETDCGIKIVNYFNFKTSVKLDFRNFPYHVMEQLFKNHFDVFGLIGKGQAFSYWEIYKEEK